MNVDIQHKYVSEIHYEGSVEYKEEKYFFDIYIGRSKHDGDWVNELSFNLNNEPTKEIEGELLDNLFEYIINNVLYENEIIKI